VKKPPNPPSQGFFLTSPAIGRKFQSARGVFGFLTRSGREVNPMQDKWEDYRQKASELISKAIDSTQRLTKIGQIRVDILSLKREIDRQFTLLGKHVYQLAKEDRLASLADDETLQNTVTKVDELKERIAQKEAQIEELRKPKTE
jgi:hypothetical protein